MSINAAEAEKWRRRPPFSLTLIRGKMYDEIWPHSAFRQQYFLTQNGDFSGKMPYCEPDNRHFTVFAKNT
jgi:hypothetical protein